MFQTFFVEEIEKIRTSLPTSSDESVMSPACVRSFELFEQVSSYGHHYAFEAIWWLQCGSFTFS